jgi:hypothetical protein
MAARVELDQAVAVEQAARALAFTLPAPELPAIAHPITIRSAAALQEMVERAARHQEMLAEPESQAHCKPVHIIESADSIFQSGRGEISCRFVCKHQASSFHCK